MTHHFPSSVHVNHLTNFSTRLYYQLQHKTHRETLAGVEEAFSKAMGFENTQAAHIASKANGMLGFLPIGQKTFHYTTLPNVKIYLLFDWAKSLWQTQYSHLEKAPDLNWCQQELARIWKYTSWNDVVSTIKNGFFTTDQQGLYVANNLKQLHSIGHTHQSVQKNNALKIYYTFGQNDNKQWLGCGYNLARSHFLITGTAEKERMALTIKMLSHRIQEGDSIVVFNSDQTGIVRNAILQQTQQAGREKQTRWFNGDEILIPTYFTAETLLQWLAKLVCGPNKKQSEPLNNWIAFIAKQWFHNWTKTPINKLSPLIGGLCISNDTEQNLWNKLSIVEQTHLQTFHKLTRHYSLTTVNCQFDTPVVYVVRVPSGTTHTDEDRLQARICHAAFSPCHHFQEKMDTSNTLQSPAQQNKPLVAFFNINGHIDGCIRHASVQWGFARALGWVMVTTTHNHEDLNTRNLLDENKRAIIQNCATQLFVNTSDPSLLNVLYQDRIETVRL